ncbi:MAG: hypothetical protein CFH01_00989 [Alphaproteobacteria bacterium MarineAlpha2_Bin1]|nr:MAG: hypothetical protein CFH01_00989 [Alphaproteobacteria bacterium MarineAlpha2_Bin1]|tara:strand:+ start:637 stop:900 length:264 start_codon:yes stop_codon:yes gene_type:complete
MKDSKAKKLKKLVFRSMHRGTKEMDIILGKFAIKNLHKFSENELNEFENILEIPDDILFNWYMKNSEIPEIYDTKILKLIMNFKVNS